MYKNVFDHNLRPGSGIPEPWRKLRFMFLSKSKHNTVSKLESRLLLTDLILQPEQFIVHLLMHILVNIQGYAHLLQHNSCVRHFLGKVPPIALVQKHLAQLLTAFVQLFYGLHQLRIDAKVRNSLSVDLVGGRLFKEFHGFLSLIPTIYYTYYNSFSLQFQQYFTFFAIFGNISYYTNAGHP